MRSAHRSTIVLALVTALEGYDWVTFLSLLPYLTKGVLSGAGSSLNAGFVIFAAGFAARPVGGLLFGRAADRTGRWVALRAAVIVGLGATVAMAMVPSAAAGAAPLVVLAARLGLGLAHGGIGGVANAYSYELRDPAFKFEPTVLVYAMAGWGKIVSLLTTLIVVESLGPAAMVSWGWRVPYVAAAGFTLLLLWWMRIRPATAGAPLDAPARGVVMVRSALAVRIGLVLALTGGTAAAYNIWIASAVPYATAHLGISERLMLAVSLAQTTLFVILVVGAGRLIRRYSLSRVYRGAAIALALLSAPILALTEPTGTAPRYLAGTVLATVVLAALCAALPGVIAALFPPAVRALGNGVPYAIAVALLGGTAPGLREATTNHYGWFALYVVLCCAATAITATLIADNDEPLTAERRRVSVSP